MIKDVIIPLSLPPCHQGARMFDTSAKPTSGQLHVSLAENLRDSGGKILGAVCPQPADLFVWVNLATCPKRLDDGGGPLQGPGSKSLNYFISCTNARLAGWVGIVLNSLPARSCCWSSTLRSQVAKLTLSEAIAE